LKPESRSFEKATKENLRPYVRGRAPRSPLKVSTGRWGV